MAWQPEKKPKTKKLEVKNRKVKRVMSSDWHGMIIRQLLDSTDPLHTGV